MYSNMTKTKYTEDEKSCAHALVCMSMQMDWLNYEKKFVKVQPEIPIQRQNIYNISDEEYCRILRESLNPDRPSSASISQRIAAGLKRRANQGASPSVPIQ